ncbi:hypothetical protein E4U30_006362 [Claviceps sp. LM220 group G6]|nr:hypothetical protein E4U15_007730 [Claviceps sp. LM218 group G6]KAG6091732.1 hypothetical protein E4U30_006362 [Claviceps sp. LM220 group G6]KAG6105866.1 hypothetical protein E4U31_001181 [Claviceps sp. LM219 group G6]
MATAARRVVHTLSAPLCKSALHRRALRLTNTIPTHSHQTRAFAASRSAPSVPRTRYTIPKDDFTLANIPQNAFDRAIDYYCRERSSRSDSDSYTRISSAKCYGVAQRAEMAIRGGASPYSLSFSDVEGISAETMHMVACVMFAIVSHLEARNFSMALWASASAKGLRPATLTLAKYLVHTEMYGKLVGLSASEARFKSLVASGHDADAMAVEGHLLYQQKRYEAAKTVLERALEIGGHPDWRNYCELRLGKTYTALDKDNDARRVLEKLADLGMADAEAPLAELYLKRRWEGWELRTYRAANLGKNKLFTQLSEEEMKKHEDGERTNEERLLWSIEWSRLSEDRGMGY